MIQYPHQIIPLVEIQLERHPLQKVQILLRTFLLPKSCNKLPFGRHPPMGRPLQIIPLHYLLIRIEHIRHNNDIVFADRTAFDVALGQFVEAVETGDEGFGVAGDVVEIVLKDFFQEFELTALHCF